MFFIIFHIWIGLRRWWRRWWRWRSYGSQDDSSERSDGDRRQHHRLRHFHLAHWRLGQVGKCQHGAHHLDHFRFLVTFYCVALMRVHGLIVFKIRNTSITNSCDYRMNRNESLSMYRECFWSKGLNGKFEMYLLSPLCCQLEPFSMVSLSTWPTLICRRNNPRAPPGVVTNLIWFLTWFFFLLC